MKKNNLISASTGMFIWWGALLFMLVTTTPASAQQGLADARANEAAATARAQQQQMPNYTFKKGDFRVLLTPALDLQWNDNVTLAGNNADDDWIITPTVGVLMSYPLTARNLLQLNITAGYTRYISHDNLSSFYLQSGSGLSYDFFIEDVHFNLHDQFSYVQSASENSAVANTGTYGTFQNSIGFSMDWNFMKNLTLSLGYDHQNSLSTSSQFEYGDHSSEMGYGQIGYLINSAWTVGVESSAAYTAYGQNVLNNNQSYSAGLYADWKPDSFFHLEARGGYTLFQFDQTSQALRTSNMNSWYAGLTVSHDVTTWMTYSLGLGHEVSLGIQSDANEDWYVRPGITWNFIKGFTFRTALFYDHGDQGTDSTQIAPNGNLVSETYDWYGGELDMSHAITDRLSLSLNYRITQRSSSSNGRGYTQNIVGIKLTYNSL